MPITRAQAYDALPANAVWSCSFGYPGVAGFTEYWRTPTDLWIVANERDNRDAWHIFKQQKED